MAGRQNWLLGVKRSISSWDLKPNLGNTFFFSPHKGYVIVATPFGHHHRLWFGKWVLCPLKYSQKVKISAAVQQLFLQGDKCTDIVSLKENSHQNEWEFTRLALMNKKYDKPKKQHSKGWQKSPWSTGFHGGLGVHDPWLPKRLRSEKDWVQRKDEKPTKYRKNNEIAQFAQI